MQPYPVKQPDPFDCPIARNTDPMSSHLAADDIIKSGQREKQQEECCRVVEANPGCTSRELAERTDSDRYMFSRRLPELERQGRVHRMRGMAGNILLRKCAAGGKMCCVWFPGKEI